MRDKSEKRPTPGLLRCRGVRLSNGTFSGCAYGYGEWEPFSGPTDCPVCLGSGYDQFVREAILPHADLGDPECCGCLTGVVSSHIASIKCNECNVVVRTVPVTDIEKTLVEMELSLSLASVMCPHCRSVNLFTGFSQVLVYRCEFCGKVASEGESNSRQW